MDAIAGKVVNEDRLNAMIGQMMSDLGGAFSIGLVRLGSALGLPHYPSAFGWGNEW